MIYLDTVYPRGYGSTDIDLFIYGLSKEEATNKIHTILQLITKNMERQSHVLLSQHAITLITTAPYRHVQIILRLYRYVCDINTIY